MKLKSFCTAKEMVTKLKRQPQNGKMPLLSDNGVIIEYTGNSRKLNSPPKNQ
jgi:hypothetical protein